MARLERLPRCIHASWEYPYLKEMVVAWHGLDRLSAPSGLALPVAELPAASVRPSMSVIRRAFGFLRGAPPKADPPQNEGRPPVSDKTQRPETIALHGGWRADPATGSVAVPIYQTTSYQFRDTGHAENLFALKERGLLEHEFEKDGISIRWGTVGRVEQGAGIPQCKLARLPAPR
jgi:hypothetical protein